MGYSKEQALEENANHICPYNNSPCQSLACGVRTSGVCNILEVRKHNPPSVVEQGDLWEEVGKHFTGIIGTAQWVQAIKQLQSKYKITKL